MCDPGRIGNGKKLRGGLVCMFFFLRTYPPNSEKKKRKENGLKNNPRLKQITLGESHSDLKYNFKLQQLYNLINNTQVHVSVS